MPRLIDADALMLRLAHYHAHSWGKVERAYGVTIVEIHNAPTIDAEPVRHGRWVHSKKHLWYKNKDGEVDNWQLDCGYHNGPRCEVCGESFCKHCDPDWAEYECEIGHYVCSVCGQPTKTGDMNYCPHCGAKMDGGEEK